MTVKVGPCDGAGMAAATSVREVPARVGRKPRYGDGLRATWGAWKPHGVAVAELVGMGWSVSEAVRHVARQLRIPEQYAFSGIRGAYYVQRAARRNGGRP